MGGRVSRFNDVEKSPRIREEGVLVHFIESGSTFLVIPLVVTKSLGESKEYQ